MAGTGDEPPGPRPGVGPVPQNWSRTGEVLFGSALMLAMFAGNLPQYALGVLAPVLTDELGIGEGLLGALASCLYLAAALVARSTGPRIDTLGGRGTLAFLFLTATGSLVLMAAAVSWVLLLCAVLLAGVAIGANNPVTNRLIALHVPPGRRGLVIGIKQIGVKLAHVAAGVVVPFLVITTGWRPGLLVVAVALGVVAALALRAVPQDPRTRQPRHTMPVATPREVRRRVAWLRLYAVSMGVGMSAITTYLPLHAVHNVGLSLVQGGLVVTSLGLSAVVARLVWAAVAERTGRPATVLVVLGVGGGLSLGAIAAAPAVGAWLLWVGACVAGTTAGAWNVVAHLTVITEVPLDRAAAGTGLLQATFLLGLAVGAPLFGALVEVSNSFQVAWVAAGLLSCIAVATAWRERRRRQPRWHLAHGGAVRG